MILITLCLSTSGHSMPFKRAKVRFFFIRARIKKHPRFSPPKASNRLLIKAGSTAYSLTGQAFSKWEAKRPNAAKASFFSSFLVTVAVIELEGLPLLELFRFPNSGAQTLARSFVVSHLLLCISDKKPFHREMGGNSTKKF